MDLNADIKLVLSYEANKSKWKNNFESEEWKLANKVSSIVMMEGLNRNSNCGCIDDLFNTLKTLSQEKINLKQNQMQGLFKLKEGKMISLHCFNEDYTNANLTDQKAIDVLKKYPSCIAEFESYPSNWKELCEKGLPEVGSTNPAVNNPSTPAAGTPPAGNGNSNPREVELLAMSRDDLMATATKLADDKSLKNKPRHNTGAVKLVKYILDNE